MKKYLESYIKPLIDEFPQIGTILNSFDIGCTDCQVGTCKLIDIVKIHNMNEVDVKNMIQQMGEVIYKGKPFYIPEIKHNAVKPKTSFSPALRKMVEEHVYIIKVVSNIPAILEKLAADTESTIPYIEKSIEFIRNYADKYHHAKEEDLLFKFFDPNFDIIKVMLEDHSNGRNFVKNTAQGIKDRDVTAISDNLTGYCTLLKQHIKKEDEVLYPWMDRTLSTHDAGELYAQCQKVEEEFGKTPKDFETFAESINKEFSGIRT